MKRFFLIAVSALAALGATAQEKLSYSLPRTSLEFTVTAVRTDFTAGPYAAYAEKYLGIDVRTQDEVSWRISEVELRSYTEADPSQRFSYLPDASAAPAMLSLTSQGLVAGYGPYSASSGWKFPAEEQHQFFERPANLASAQGTLYSSGSKAVRQEVVVGRTDEAKAAEVAERIFAIRENKYNILVGDTDATYSGEAMKAAIDALDALEAELLSLFTGCSSSNRQKAVFEVIPQPGQQDAVAFRLSASAGLVAADDFSGDPYYIRIVPEEAAPVSGPSEETAPRKGRAPAVKQILKYRIPSVCSVSLSDGVTTILRQRVPVYQLGTIENYPIY